METYLIYIAKAAIAAGAFYIAFLLLFQNQKHFTFNRIYLPVSLALSFVIPLITFTTIKYIEPVTFPDSGSFAYLPVPTEIPQQPAFVFEWYHYLFGLYLLGTAGFLLHLLLGHLKAINIIQKSRVQKIFDKLVNVTPKDVHPFSFFSKIVVSEKTLSHPDLEMIVSHENIHVREKHTLDILFTEIMFLLQWFNPFAWLLKDAVKNNLEYKTDHEIAKHYNAKTYQLAMVALADKQGIAPFLTALNGNQLKNRIVMMKKKTENKYAIVKQLAVLPLLAVLVMGLSNREVKTEVIQVEKKVVIYVDGKEIPNTTESLKNINLSESIDVKEIIEALKLENVKATSLKETVNGSELHIRTNDYIPDNLKLEVLLNGVDITSSEPNLKNLDLTKPINQAEVIDALNIKNVMATSLLENVDGYSLYIKTGEYKPGTNKMFDEVMSNVDFSFDKNPLIHLIKSKNTIYGIVVDAISDKPISGASVLLEGFDIEIFTDKNGEYKIEFGENKKPVVVKFSANGYDINRDVYYGTSEEMNIHLNAVSVVTQGKQSIKPLYIIDGKEFDIEKHHRLGDGVYSYKGTILNDSIAVKEYGEKGKNGVVILNSEFEEGPIYIVDVNSGEIEIIDVLKDQFELNIKPKSTDKNGNPVFYKVDEMPKFPGREMALLKYIANKTKYPEIARENGIQGKVYVSFIITKEGKVTEPTISRGVDPDLDKEALRVVSSLPDWKPGKKHGQAVNVSYTIPITFGLQNQNNTKENAVGFDFGSFNDVDPTMPPLYVVDGIVKISLSDLSPDSIESISVLKDQSSTILYGDKGKNGVILITTKKYGQSNKSGNVTVTGYGNNAALLGNPAPFGSATGKTNQPLVLVNGKETRQTLNNVDPATIESVNILKDETATKKYGDKGKNGVILITTKNREKIEPAKVFGNKQFIGNINWINNQKHSSKELTNLLGIKKGDLYSKEIIEERMYGKVSDLYMDNGYLFFNITVTEKLKNDNTVDLEFKVYEGTRWKVGKVEIKGKSDGLANEILIKSGDLFSRSKLNSSVRTLNELIKQNAEEVDVDVNPLLESQGNEFSLVNLVFNLKDKNGNILIKSKKILR